MTQPPYPQPSGNPMLRFSLFVAALTILVAVGYSQPRHDSSTKNSVCVCIPSRAGLLLKSAIARTQARSATLLTIRAAISQ